MGNILVLHGGAPTSVINSSLAGVLFELKAQNFKDKILACRYGTKGLLTEDFINLSNLSINELELLKRTPGSAIGTSRTPLDISDYQRAVEILKKHNISRVLFNGGNGSMDTLGKIYALAKESNISCVGIPKTVDNDLMETDHSPGFASSARFLVNSVKAVAYDVLSMPIHVSIIESMGRNTGWLTASSCLARDNNVEAPDLLLLPECPFDQDVFLLNVEKLCRKKGGVVVVASEGLKDKNGAPIVEPVMSVGRATYFGDVSSHLANLILKNLNIKARSEKPGLLQRATFVLASKVDVEEAFLVGRESVRAVLSGVTGAMIAIERLSTFPYVITTKAVPIEKVMLKERLFPLTYLNEDKTNVTEEFIAWAKPLVGEISQFISFL